ncbi:MAG: SelB C-terminal domain-containing protein, partial [Phycisphaerae bacterium]
RAPVVCAHGQRFILRDESAQHTIGGGVILRPVSRRLTRRESEQHGRLRALMQNDSTPRVAEAIRAAGFERLADETLACRCGVEPADVPAIRRRLIDDGLLVTPIASREVHRDVVAALSERAVRYLRGRHQRAPDQPGMPTEGFTGWIDRRSTPGLGKVLLADLQSSGVVTLRGPFAALSAFRPALSPEEEALMAALIDELTAANLDPPLWPKLRAVSGRPKQQQAKLLELARADPRLVRLTPQHVIAAAAIDRLKQCVQSLGASGRPFKLAEVRDALKLSRRAVQPLLEHLDRIQYTRRVGDERIVIG